MHVNLRIRFQSNEFFIAITRSKIKYLCKRRLCPTYRGFQFTEGLTFVGFTVNTNALKLFLHFFSTNGVNIK